MKKGRHRRFEEARAFKLRTKELTPEPCAECGADPEDEHASWCLATEDDIDEVDATDDGSDTNRGAGPAPSGDPLTG